jgi:hypothetical protein
MIVILASFPWKPLVFAYLHRWQLYVPNCAICGISCKQAALMEKGVKEIKVGKGLSKRRSEFEA